MHPSSDENLESADRNAVKSGPGNHDTLIHSQRIKRPKQEITVKLYQDQLAMLDKYGRFIDDSRDYIISQALELVFKRDREFARWAEQERNAGSKAEHTITALNRLVQHHPLDHSGI